MTTNPHIGSSLDDLVEEDGILDEEEAIALIITFIYRFKKK